VLGKTACLPASGPPVSQAPFDALAPAQRMMEQFMKKLLLLTAILFAPAIAWAGDEAFDCNKKFDGEVECKVKKDKVAVKAVAIDGGQCAAPNDPKVYGKVMNKGDKFKLPGAHDCFYVSGFTITTSDGKTQKFYAF
jgi:hypothetical protein